MIASRVTFKEIKDAWAQGRDYLPEGCGKTYFYQGMLVDRFYKNGPGPLQGRYTAVCYRKYTRRGVDGFPHRINLEDQTVFEIKKF